LKQLLRGWISGEAAVSKCWTIYEQEGVMKKIFVFFAVLLSVATAGTVFAQGGLTKIAENVYSYVDVKNGSAGNSFAANAGIIVGKDGIVVVDTLISAEEAQRFIKDIRKISGKPILYVIDTHYHLDHTFGNAEFAKLGAVIVAHANCRENMVKYGEETLKNIKEYGLTPEQMEGTEIAYPTLTFTDRMSIDLGDERVELIYVAPSHTTGNILVQVPERKVLFTGDILFTDFHPYMADGDIPGWIRNLDYIETLDVDRIVPGHGPLSDKKDISDMRSYLIAFDSKAKELAAHSNDAKAIAAEMLKSLPVRAQGQWMIPVNIQIKYLKKDMKP
jgi:cyclase